jgi:hypothetical protein
MSLSDALLNTPYMKIYNLYFTKEQMYYFLRALLAII